MELKKHIWFLFPLLLLSLFAMRTFWGPDYFDGHDSQAHIVRLYEYDRALKAGQIPPRWAGGLFGGRGYPVFIFAYPLPYIISEVFHLLGANLAVSIKLTTVLAYIISALAMYFFANYYWQSKKAGFLSALLWAFSPYMFVKIFITGSFGVVVSYTFIPLTFLFLHQTIIKPNFKHALFLSLAVAAWLLSHLLTPIIFSPLLAIFALIHLIKVKEKSKAIKYLLFSLILTIGFSAWFILPAIFEMRYTHFNEFVNFQYANHFVALKRLLYSKWGTGAPGWSDNPLSQQVGIAQWLAVLFSFWLILKRKISQLSYKLLPFLIIFPLSIFLMLKISRPVWELFAPLQSVGIPWRFLSLAVFTAAVCAGFIIKVLKNKPLLLVFNFLLLGALALYGNRHHLRINEVRVYDQQFFENYQGVATGWNEHLPIWVKNYRPTPPKQKVEIISGSCETADLKVKSNQIVFKSNCIEPSVLQLNTAYYPGWQIKTNNQDITSEVKSNLASANGMMQFQLASGSHQLTAEFKDTPFRLISQTISLISIGFVLFLVIFSRRRPLKRI